jgi:hypothetical protein
VVIGAVLQRLLFKCEYLLFVVLLLEEEGLGDVVEVGGEAFKLLLSGFQLLLCQFGQLLRFA